MKAQEPRPTGAALLGRRVLGAGVRRRLLGPRLRFRLLERASCSAAAMGVCAVVADEVTPRVRDLRRHTVYELQRIHLDVRRAGPGIGRCVNPHTVIRKDVDLAE